DPRVTITTIGVGYDADALALTSLARAGRGHYLPYIPGQRASDAALTALETTYGAALEYPTLEMPDGIEQIAPQQLPTIRAGQEIMIVGRLSKKQVNGTVILSGSIGNHRFNRRYPVSITASSSPANAIVSNWWASTYIDDLQLSGSAEVFARIIALSRAYGVMSRYTSLLVLENEAIFQPFGVKQAPNPLQWTGADELETEQANAEDDAESAFSTLTAAEAEAVLAGGASDSILQGGERTRKKGESKTASEARSLGVSVDSDFGDESAPAETADAKQKTVGQGKRVGRGRESGRWMKKIWVREALILKAAHASSDDLYQADEATEALDQKPDSRDRYRELVRVLCRIGNLERARSTVEQWLERDRLDPEAIVYLSNVMGRQGLRDDALRYLSGIVDLLPDDTVFHERMAGAFERAEMFDNACAHRVALAEMVPGDINAVAAAVRCERAFGRDQQAIGLLNALPKQTLRQEVEEKAAQTAEPEPMKGELLLSASWKPKEDIDLSLITPQGARVSWMGGRSTAVSAKASALDQEILGLERASAGRYMLEASRIKPNAVSPINGIMKVEVLGIKHEFNFSLSSERTPVGRIVVRRRARLVPR
ncbi:MAG: hypothetical protein JXA30_13445, partial [Deltaproteobacteria bacterium]|nr:hypothetical protein [Deltaproteobacteria bacterium]